MSIPPYLRLPAVARRVDLATPQGPLAAVEARPARDAPVSTALLVPGFTGSKEDFVGVLEPLASAGHQVAAIDQRGQFESPHAELAMDGTAGGAYDVTALADDLLAVAAGLGDGPVHLLGHSFGGLVARAAVLAHPSAWRSLTLLCSGPAAIPPPAADRLRLLLGALGGAGTDPDADMRDAADLPTVYAAMRRFDDQAGVPAPPPEIEAFLRRRFLANDPAGVRRMAEQLLGEPDRTSELARAEVPTLVAYGVDDNAWPPALQADMGRRLGAQVVALDGCGHSPAAERPVATAALLASFWRTAGDSGGGPPESPDPAGRSAGAAPARLEHWER